MTFEDFLEERFIKQYSGTKDGAEKAFDRWLCGLDVSDLMEWGQMWGEREFILGKLEAVKELGKLI